MRVHELAKELGIPSKELIERIQQLGGTVKNHMSLVDDAILAKLKAGKSQPAAQPAPKKETVAPKVQTATATAKEPVTAKPATKVSAPVAPAPAAPKPVAPPQEIRRPAAPVPSHAESYSSRTASPASAVAEPPEIRFPIMVGSLATQLNMKVSDLIKTLMSMGIFANVNQLLNEEIGLKVAQKLGISIKKAEDEVEKILEKEELDESKYLKPRPPVVTMMGHVDHGKTSLLDAIRKTNVAASEKGFITQHIGAYGVDIPGKGHVTFLDTPGHEAFTSMRARGANVTDVVVLVIAADDGVMPQTVEAAAHAREAGCPIVVAINKSDLPGANVSKVLTGLQKMDLMPEEWGGKTICIKVSAKTGQGIDQLLEMLLLEAEVLELKANPNRNAVGTVIEGHLSKGSGPVASVIVQKGTLKTGDVIVCGPYMGRVRALKNDRGKTVKEAGPSYAVEVSGLSGVPEAGETFYVVDDEKIARKVTEKRLLEERERQSGGANKHLSLEELYQRISEGNFKELKIILKSDVQGSAEALAQSLEKLSNDQCRVRVIHAAVGGINESDVVLAAASDAIVLGFHVKADQKAQEISEKEGVDIRFYNIIYEAVEDVRKALEGLLEPTYKEVIEGRVQIRKVFKISRLGTIGGGMVMKGKIARNHKIRVIRDNVVLHDGKLSSLKRFKDDVRDVAQGYECGLSIEGFDDLRENDIIETYRMEKVVTRLA
jgi:translation initiation factor IF-2